MALLEVQNLQTHFRTPDGGVNRAVDGAYVWRGTRDAETGPAMTPNQEFERQEFQSFRTRRRGSNWAVMDSLRFRFCNAARGGRGVGSQAALTARDEFAVTGPFREKRCSKYRNVS